MNDWCERCYYQDIDESSRPCSHCSFEEPSCFVRKSYYSEFGRDTAGDFCRAFADRAKICDETEIGGFNLKQNEWGEYTLEIQEEKKPVDNVNNPSHYNQGGIECIDAIRASLGLSEFADYCKGNILKYVWRYRFKNGIEDLRKARVYLNWMIEAEEKLEEQK